MLRKFRAYRQPTKSLTGSVVLPRGTCVDLSVSGVGLNNSGVEGGAFGLTEAPLFGHGPVPPTVDPGSFSRMAILFSASGRVAFLIREDSINGTLHRSFLDGSSMIYLMVGRSDQVLPGFPANPGNLSESARRAALQHPDLVPAICLSPIWLIPRMSGSPAIQSPARSRHRPLWPSRMRISQRVTTCQRFPSPI